MTQTLLEIYDAEVAAGALKADAAQRAALKPLAALGAALEKARPAGLARLWRRAGPPPKGVYLWGDVGRGKSMLMDVFFHHLPLAEKRRVHFHAFMQKVHAGLHAARKTGVEDALAPVAAEVAAGLRLLAFDELQITDITDAMIVGRLFQMLRAAGVSIVATSNRPPEGLYENGLNRALFLPFVAHLRAEFTVHHLESAQDYRRHLLEKAPVYLTPAGAAARAALDKIWGELTGGAKGEALEIALLGRVLRLPLYASGVARAGFWDLCGAPLGPADYLALAGAVRVLILEDIPQLSAANYNEAKRFVTLIDALYEGKVRLICSAAAAPEALYLEGEGRFEFARTASRLHEMQGAAWGAKTGE